MHDSCPTHLWMAPINLMHIRLLPDSPPATAWLSDSSLHGNCTTPTWLAFATSYMTRKCMTHAWLAYTVQATVWTAYSWLLSALHVHDPYMTRVSYGTSTRLFTTPYIITLADSCLTPISMPAIWKTCLTLFVSDSPMHDAYLAPMSMIHVLLACTWLLTDLTLHDSCLSYMQDSFPTNLRMAHMSLSHLCMTPAWRGGGEHLLHR